MLGGPRGGPYLSKLLSEDKPRGRVNNPCVQSRGVEGGGIRGPEMLGVLERSHWTRRCRSRVDLDLATAFGHSPKSSGLPHQNLGQGSGMVEFISTPLTVYGSQDHVKSAPCARTRFSGSKLYSSDFSTATRVLGKIWGLKADTAPSVESQLGCVLQLALLLPRLRIPVMFGP